MRELREDQAGALEQLRDAVANGHDRIVMQAPTGFGKTVLSSAIVNSARGKRKKVLYTVPTIALVDQTVQMFHEQGIRDVGVLQAAHSMTDWSQPVQIASVQTLQKRSMPECDLVLLDEVHKWFVFYEKWLAQDGWQVPVIGLSATPWTRGLGSWFKHLIVASTTQELIDAGHLCPFRVMAPSHPDLSGVRTVAGDYHEGELSTAMQKGNLVGDAVETWIKRAEGRPTLVYAVDRAHAKHLQQKFQAAGVMCGYQDAFTPDEDRRVKKSDEWTEGRRTIKRKFHSGEYPVVCNVGTLTVGIDWDVRCISMCRPTKSDMLFVQIVGRGLRTAEGKDDLLVLDHSDNHKRLGFVTDVDRSYTGLHAGKTPANEHRTAGIRLPKECPQCAFLRSPRLSTCPQCGFKAEMVSSVISDPGELRELKPKPKQQDPGRDLSTHAAKLLFFAELRTYGIQHGYKEGWASNQYREKVGTWPSHDMKHAPVVGVSLWTRNWIKSRMIAYAKSNRAYQPTAFDLQRDPSLAK